MKSYPALDVRCDSTDLLLAMVDDFKPTAAEEHDHSVRVFFSNAADRDAARITVASRFPAAAVDVADEDWARRSQENLQPITIGRVTISPRPIDSRTSALSPQPSAIEIVIVPSMGFGTGHHATTRLCLDALQAIDLMNAFVLDVGTGSGILAIAAVRLGAARALGIDDDADAIQAARENLAHNLEAPDTEHPAPRRISFELADLDSSLTKHEGAVDVLTANLTGALLVRAAAKVEAAVRPGGLIVVSGVQVHERGEVVRAFRSASIVRQRTEDEWIGLTMKKP